MRLITGDENGLLKLVDVSSREYFSYLPKIGKQSRICGVRSMCATSDDQKHDDSSISIIRNDGSVENWVYKNGSLLCTSQYNTDMNNPIALIKNNGMPDTFSAINSEGAVKVLKFDENFHHLEDIKSKHPISAAISSIGGYVLLGGNECDLHILSINTKDIVWEAKNVPHDNLNLRVPIYITSLTLQHENQPYDSTQIITGTGYKQIRIYNVKTSKRPILSHDLNSEYRVTKVAINRENDTQLLYADTAGGCYIFDLKMNRSMFSFQGSSGAIRDIQQQHLSKSTGSYVATVGLDRFLRVYNSQSRQLYSSCYLSNRLNCCHFLSSDLGEKAEKGVGRKRRANRGGANKEEMGQEDGEEEEGDERGFDDYVKDYYESSSSDGEEEGVDEKRKAKIGSVREGENSSGINSYTAGVYEEESGEEEVAGRGGWTRGLESGGLVDEEEEDGDDSVSLGVGDGFDDEDDEDGEEDGEDDVEEEKGGHRNRAQRRNGGGRAGKSHVVPRREGRDRANDTNGDARRNGSRGKRRGGKHAQGGNVNRKSNSSKKRSRS